MTRQQTRRRFIGAAGVLAAVAADPRGSLAEDDAAEASLGSVKIVGVSCSPRKGKSTATALRICLDAAEKVAGNVEVELIDLAGLRIPGEPAAGVALQPGERDDFPALVPKLDDPKLAGIIIATPVYFGNMSYLCKAFLDRCNVLRRKFALAGKVAGVVAVAGGRNGGQELTIRSVHTCLMGQGMIVVGDAPPTGHWGGTVWSGCPGGVTNDQYGLSATRNLGRHVAELALQLRAKE